MFCMCFTYLIGLFIMLFSPGAPRIRSNNLDCSPSYFLINPKCLQGILDKPISEGSGIKLHGADVIGEGILSDLIKKKRKKNVQENCDMIG